MVSIIVSELQNFRKIANFTFFEVKPALSNFADVIRVVGTS